MTWGDDGLRWPVWRQGGALLAVQGQAAAAGFTSSTAETVSAVKLYLSRVAGSPALTLEVYEKADLPSTPTTATFRPNEDVSAGAGGQTVTLSSGSTRYTLVDEASLDTSDFYDVANDGGPGSPSLRVASSGFTLPAGDSILAVKFKAVIEVLTVGDGASANIIGRHTDSTGENVETVDSLTPSDGLTTVVYSPDTRFDGSDWTEAEVQGFDGSNSFQFYTNTTDAEIRVHQVWMEVDYAALPVASGSAAPSDDGWVTFTLESSWSKTATDYVLVVRKTNGAGQVVWNTLDSGDDCPHVSWVSYEPTMTSAGKVSALGDSQTAAHAVVLDVSGSASADSQPYATLSREKVYTGRTVEQEFTPSSGFTAGWVSFVAALESGDTDADLTVKIRQRSDDAQQGGDLTFTAEDGDEAPRKLRELDGNLASTGSLSTAQHYVEWSSTATEGQGWEVAVLDTRGQGGGFGGTTDAATAGGTEDTDTDAPHAVTAVPSQVSGVSASDGSGQVTVSWTATALGADFSRYVVSRGGSTVAYITDESTTSWVDTEAKLGTSEDWTVQVENVDGETSLPSTAASATASGDGFRLVSNHDTTVNLDLGMRAQPTLELPAHRQVSYPHGRDYALVRRGTETLGDRWSIQVVLDSGTNRALFDDLLAASRADVPHLTMLSPWGERWHVDLHVSGGQFPVHTLAYADATVVEVAGSPTPVQL